MLRFLTLFLLSLLVWPLWGQQLVSYTLRASLSVDQLAASYDPGTPLQRGVDIYTVLYVMDDVHGNPDTASGALSIPWTETDEQFALVCDMHGTTDRSNVPSSGFFLGPALASNGFIVAEPDFLGLGTSRGFHPYIHADSEARAGVEMLRVVHELLPMLGIQPRDELFVSGYSQGGHAAMALHRMLQEDLSHEFTVTASAPMSGPYSVSEIMFERMMDDLNYIPGIAFMPYIVLSYQTVYGNLFDELADIFKPPYVGPIQNFWDSNIGLGSMTSSLFGALLLNTGNFNPRDMLRDSVVQILQTDPASHPIWQALVDNDVLDWVPQVPMRLYYCGADEQVPFTNSLLAEDVFMQGGAFDAVAENKGATFNHGQCIIPAYISAVDFFNSFMPTSIDQILTEGDLELFPNPSTSFVHVRNKTHREYLRGEMALYDLQGRLVLQDAAFAGTVEVAHLHPGIYWLQIAGSEGTTTLRFVKS
jgi:hypothetical protein